VQSHIVLHIVLQRKQQTVRVVTPHVCLKIMSCTCTDVCSVLTLCCRYCSKGSLYGLLHSPGCYLSWVEVVAMLLGAARGMEHLHANSVLHRWGPSCGEAELLALPLPPLCSRTQIGACRNLQGGASGAIRFVVGMMMRQA
jgi:hypothetical protein